LAIVRNPILPGFHPDPSILHVGKDYYIATSTFEWYPGVQLHHSTDLINWELVGYPLQTEHLNMLGNPNSGGVWAPCLSYADGTFYLIYTDCKSYNGIFKDTHNYLTTAPDITGPWSEPVYLNSSGFDPSLFHDTDGRKWLVNMLWDYRTWKNSFGGILLQEYSAQEKKLIGKPKNIFSGTTLGLTEGPHLYRRGSYYYLLTAEGGTSYSHAVTLARSTTIDGPYEVCPWNPILTSYSHPDRILQKAGHASLVEGPGGRWYLVHLCGRPVGTGRYCILGRETCIEEVIWEEDWLRLAAGGNSPFDMLEIEGTELEVASYGGSFRDDFDRNSWNLQFQSLRIPLDRKASLTERPGFLRLYGGESLSSMHEQSLLACRQQDYRIKVTTRVEFYPESFQQLAGLVYYYDTISHYYFYITDDETEGRVLTLLSSCLGKQTQPIGTGIRVPGSGPVWLALTTNKETAEFSYSLDGITFKETGISLDATVLSDDYYMKLQESRFTGAFVGICCQDLSGQGAYADFDFFEYQID
jgi:xylan 1,4-beta-xylosidase